MVGPRWRRNRCLGDRHGAVIESAAPDWLLLLGDRGEQLAAGLVGLHLGVAIAHLHGGERTLGAVDDAIRDMVSRLAHLHFVADPSAAARLERLGEQPWRIHVTGAPGLTISPTFVPRRSTRFASVWTSRAIHTPSSCTTPRRSGSDPVADLREVLAAIADAGLPPWPSSPTPTLAAGPSETRSSRRLPTFGRWLPRSRETSTRRSSPAPVDRRQLVKRDHRGAAAPRAGSERGEQRGGPAAWRQRPRRDR